MLPLNPSFSTQNALEKALRDKRRISELLEEVQADLEEEKARNRRLARKVEEASRVAAATADVKLKEAQATIQYLRGELVQVRTAVQALALRKAEPKGLGHKAEGVPKRRARRRGSSPQLDEIKNAIIENGTEMEAARGATNKSKMEPSAANRANANAFGKAKNEFERRRAQAIKLARRRKARGESIM